MAGFVAHCGGLVARAVAQNGAQQARGYSHAVARRSSRVMYARGLRMSTERNSDAAVISSKVTEIASEGDCSTVDLVIVCAHPN